MLIDDISSESLQMMIRAMVDMPEVERIELVSGKRGPFLRVHLQSVDLARLRGDQRAAASVRLIAGSIRAKLGGHLSVSIVDDTLHARAA